MVLVATQVKRRRGTTAENDAFTGAEGEITVDTTTHEIRVHDGSTVGGHIIPTKDYSYSKAESNDLLSNKANVDMDNLTSTGKNIANWSSNVSNCITYIPQDIKLELNNGTLTLKAGSKVYVPNSPGVFDEVVIANDLTTTDTNNTQFMVFYRNGVFERMRLDKCFSGASEPTGFGTSAVWYDTTNNTIKRTTNSGSTWVTDASFPLAICTSSDGVITSIDQVFNGFGYIGNTAFALPGVKGIGPYGRNTDGTLVGRDFALTEVLTATSTTHGIHYLTIVGVGYPPLSLMIDKQEKLYYSEIENYIYYFGAIHPMCICGVLSVTNGGPFGSFTQKTVFYALDKNDREFIANCAMPSAHAMGLTLGSSGAGYTAPADGYFFLSKTAGTAYTKIDMTNRTAQFSSQARAGSSTGDWIYCWIPASKGDSVKIEYTVTGSTNAFRFVYANGVQ